MKNIPTLRFPEFVNDREWEEEKFSDIYTLKITNSFSRDKLNYDNGLVKNIHYGDIHTKFSTLFDVIKENVPFINSSISLENIKDENYCQESDMVFADASEDLEDVGKSIEVINLNNEKLLSGLHTLLARQKKNKLITGFGGYLFKSNKIRGQIKRESQGTKVLSISGTRLSNINISYPKDKQEQQKIADCLSSVDGLISAQSQKVELLKEHKKGLMQQLFPSNHPALSGTPPKEGNVPKLRFPEFVNDGEWEEKKLDEVFSFLRGSSFSKADISANGINKCIHYGELFTIYKEKISDIKSFTNVENGQYSQKGDVLMPSSDVTPEGLATASVIFEDGVIIGGDVNILRLKKEISSLFVSYLLNFSKKEIMKLVSGTTVKHIYNKDIAKLLIKLPQPKEQQKIADCLSSIDNLITAQSKKLQTLKEHKKALMQQLFPSNHPALSGTPPTEGNSKDENVGDNSQNSPSLKGWQTKSDGVVKSKTTQEDKHA